MFSEELLDEIRQRLNLHELVGDYVALKKSGQSYQGLCPFHQERSPSFHVHDEKRIFHCFGCGEGGNAFHFLMKLEGLSFPEAVEKIAERVGVSLPSSTQKSQSPPKAQSRPLEILRQAAWYYHQQIQKAPEHSPIQLYLKARHLHLDSLQDFYLGYCAEQNSGLHNLLIEKGFKQKDLEASGLFRDPREFFQGRLVFPIFDGQKRVVAFGGRRIEDKDVGPKYLNSSEAPWFHKSKLFYGLHAARQAIREKKRLLLVEGYMDVLRLHSLGFKETLAPLGTSLSEAQARLLKRLNVEVILFFDGDSAGKKAQLKALEILLGQNIFPSCLDLEPEEDPDSFALSQGALGLEKRLKNPRNLFQSLFDKTCATLEGSQLSPQERSLAAQDLLKIINKISDPLTAKLYRQKLSQILEVPESYLLRGVPQKKINLNSPKPFSEPKRALFNWQREEKDLLALWLTDQKNRKSLREDLQIDDFYTKKVGAIFQNFFDYFDKDPLAPTDRYLELVEENYRGELSALAFQEESALDPSEREKYLKLACLRLKENKLRRELKSLNLANQREGTASQDLSQKIKELSQLLKQKEAIHEQ